MDLSFIGSDLPPFTQTPQAGASDADPSAALIQQLLDRLGTGGGMPTSPGMGAPAPGAPPAGNLGGGNSVVEQLLKSLEMAKPPAPPHVGIGHRILGAIGDALQAMATVRAGGAPPMMGPFAASQKKAKELYQQRAFEAEAQDRALRNQIRIGLSKPGKPGPPHFFTGYNKDTGQTEVFQATPDAYGQYTYSPIQPRDVPPGAIIGQAQGAMSPTQPSAPSATPPGPRNIKAKPGGTVGTGPPGGRVGPLAFDVKPSAAKLPGQPNYQVKEIGGKQWYIDPKNPKAPPLPVMDPATGRQAEAKASSQYADTAARIDMGRFQLNTMKTHFDAMVGRGRGMGAALAAPLARHEATSSVAGWMGQGGKDMQLHETYRGSLAVTLAPLLSGSKRAVTGIMEAIRPTLPAGTDEPTVAAEKYKNISDLLDLAGSLPGATPEQRAKARGVLRGRIMGLASDPQQQADLGKAFSEADANLDPGEVLAGDAQGAMAAGRRLPASSFDRLPPDKREAEKQRFVKDGGTIVEGQ